jgi:uncharacterized protein
MTPLAPRVPAWLRLPVRPHMRRSLRAAMGQPARRADRPSAPWRWLLLVLLPLLLAAAVRAADAPRDASGLLAVPPLARVTDLAGLLKPAERQQLDDKLARFEAGRGAQIAIVIVPATQPEPIADFAQRVGDAWKIGRRGVGDGVLVTVTLEPRRIWISVARALEPALPDVTVTRISREVMAPRFRAGDFVGGLNAGLDALFGAIEGEQLPTPAGVPAHQVDAGEGVVALLLPVVLLGLAIGAVLRRIFGAPGALLAGGGAGAVAGTLLSSLLLGGIVALVVSVLSLRGGGGGRGGRVIGGRRGGWGPVIVPGGFGAGGWGSGGGGGGWGGGIGGGWSSGGGGDFAGGGGGSDW